MNFFQKYVILRTSNNNHRLGQFVEFVHGKWHQTRCQQEKKKRTEPFAEIYLLFFVRLSFDKCDDIYISRVRPFRSYHLLMSGWNWEWLKQDKTRLLLVTIWIKFLLIDFSVFHFIFLHFLWFQICEIRHRLWYTRSHFSCIDGKRNQINKWKKWSEYFWFDGPMTSKRISVNIKIRRRKNVNKCGKTLGVKLIQHICRTHFWAAPSFYAPKKLI